MNKRYFTILSFALVLAMILSACGGAATPAPTTPAEDPAGSTTAPVEVKTEAPVASEAPAATEEPIQPEPDAEEKAIITFWLDGNDMAPVIQENIVDPFNAQSKTTFVEVTVQANRWDAMRTALAGGGGPDIVGTPGPSFAIQLARAGYLLPLDEYVEKNGWEDIFLPWALNLGKVDGQLFSVPAEVETLVLYYNKTLFEKNGWEPPKTFDELTALSAEIKAQGVVPFAHANAEYRGANEWYVGEFLNHIAGPDKVYEALSGQIKWDDPAFVEAMDTLNTYQQNGYFMGGLDRYYTLTFAERDAQFASGEAAMNIEGTWFIGSALANFGEDSENKNEWDWVPVPSASGDPIYDLGIGGSLSINKSAQNPEAAAEFLTYYYSAEAQAAMVNSGYNSAPINLKADLLTGIDPRFAAIVEAMGEASQSGGYGYTSWAFFPPKTEAYLIEVEKVWSGEMTSAEFLQELQKQFDEEMEAGELPPLPER